MIFIFFRSPICCLESLICRRFWSKHFCRCLRSQWWYSVFLPCKQDKSTNSNRMMNQILMKIILLAMIICIHIFIHQDLAQNRQKIQILLTHLHVGLAGVTKHPSCNKIISVRGIKIARSRTNEYWKFYLKIWAQLCKIRIDTFFYSYLIIGLST